MNKVYVKHIRSTLKGGVNANLAPVTLITGPNGSGKSAICNSVELALSARVSDLAGRPPLADLDELVTLMIHDAPGISAYAELSNGDSCDFNADVFDGKVKPAKHSLPQYLQGYDPFIMRDLLFNLKSMGPDTVRLWLSKQLDVSIESIRANLPIETHDLFDSVVKAQATPDLHDMFSLLKKASMRSSRDFGAAERAVDGLLLAGAVMQPEDSKKNVKDKLALLRVQLAQLTQDVVTKTKNDFVAEIKTVQDELEEESQRLEVLLSKSTGDVAVKTLDILQKLAELSKWCESESRKSCPLCSHKIDPGDFVSQRQKVQAKLAEMQKVSTVTVDIRRKVTMAQSKVNNLKERLAQLKFSMSRAPDVIHDNSAKVESIKVEIEKLEVEEANWIRYEEQQKQIEHANALKMKERENNQRWKLLVECYKTGLDAAFKVGLGKFVERVNLHLDDEAHESFFVSPQGNDFGLIIDGRVTSPVALEGARWTRLLLALAMASKHAGKVRVAIPRDQALDTRSIGQMINAGLHAWSNHGVQTLIATVIPSKAKVKIDSGDFVHITL